MFSALSRGADDLSTCGPVSAAGSRPHTGTKPQVLGSAYSFQTQLTPVTVSLSLRISLSSSRIVGLCSLSLTGYHLYLVHCSETPVVLDLICQRFWFCGLRLNPDLCIKKKNVFIMENLKHAEK